MFNTLQYTSSMSIAYVLKCSLILHTVSGLINQDLGGAWIVENAERGIQLPALVPGGIYSDLMRNNIIDDVFYGCNEASTRWVSKSDWQYSRTFIVNKTLIDHDVINLVLDGIDTFAKIFVNSVQIGETENMFVQYVFDIKPYLMIGNNHIEIQFKSAVQVALDEYNKQSEEYVVVPRCVPESYNGECHVNHIRKMQASFSWDWGPALPSMGIWKQLYLEAYNSTVLKYVTVHTEPNTEDNNWNVTVYTYFGENPEASTIYGKLILKLKTDHGSITNINKVMVTENENGDFVAINHLVVPMTYVREWWPNGYGNANLYTLRISYINAQKTESTKKIIQIGFRTIELVQDIMSDGRSFYFKVNGIPIFAKGSNVIPIHILPELGQDEARVRFLLQSAKDVHMNMVRVWGGGVYESDIFYDIADEMGILIWQDLMFACSMYPSKKNFLRNVQDELKHQIRRLQHHPSIFLWAANNENEAALRQNWYNTSANFQLYQRDYIKLYVNTAKSEVLLYDPTKPFLTSSPTNGIQSDLENYVADNPQSNFYGDIHFYNYLVDGWQTAIYPTARFASEYGYQSIPSISTLLTATNNANDLALDSLFLKRRQHHPMGYTPILLLINYQLKLPHTHDPHYFKTVVYYSQIIQAMAVKVQTEHYRQWRSNINDDGEGMTMGALYWQLNDVWVAPSWSGIDFKNNWKMLHYFAKDFFAPVIVTGSISVDKKLNVFVVSDLMQIIKHATITISIFRWDSFTPVKQESSQIKILPGVSQKIHMGILNTFLSRQTNELCGVENKTECFIHLRLSSGDQLIAPDNHIFPVPLKDATIQPSKVQITNIRQIDDAMKLFEVIIETNITSLFVWLETGNIRGRFSENGFLQITTHKTVYFVAEDATAVKQLRKSLTVSNL